MKNSSGISFNKPTKSLKMKRFTNLHVSESVRNTIIVLAIFGTIAIVTYIEWSGFFH
jgi:hypothetical protein